MQTFDQALLKRYEDGIISEEQALAHADSRNDLNLGVRMTRNHGTQDAPSGLDIQQWGMKYSLRA